MIIAASLLAIPAFAPALAATVFVMRHLPKAEGSDPPLSQAGAAQAEALAERLGNRGIKAIFATPTRRATETAQPLAKRLGIPVTPYDPGNPAELVNAARAVDGELLIVGHSNTVPDIVLRLGGSAIPALGEQDYGTVFVIDTPGSATQAILLAPPK